MRTLIRTVSNAFDFFDYHITHRRLLLRSSFLKDEQYYNIDILFQSVSYLQTVTAGFEEGFELYLGDENDRKYITPFFHESPVWELRKVYVLKSGKQEYFICAGAVAIEENDLPL